MDEYAAIVVNQVNSLALFLESCKLLLINFPGRQSSRLSHVITSWTTCKPPDLLHGFACVPSKTHFPQISPYAKAWLVVTKSSQEIRRENISVICPVKRTPTVKDEMIGIAITRPRLAQWHSFHTIFIRDAECLTDHLTIMYSICKHPSTHFWSRCCSTLFCSYWSWRPGLAGCWSPRPFEHGAPFVLATLLLL